MASHHFSSVGRGNRLALVLHACGEEFVWWKHLLALRAQRRLRKRLRPMPTNIKCPYCKRALEIPDELMEKRVKCPACKMIFTATVGGSPPSSGGGIASAPRAGHQVPPSRPEETRVRRKPPPPSEEEEEEDEEEETPRVRKKGVRRRDEDDEDEEEEEEETPRARRKPVRRREEEDEDEDDEDEDDEEEEVRPRRRRKPASSSRQRAKSAVLIPAIGLMLSGGSGIVIAILFLLVNLGVINLVPDAKDDDETAGKAQWVSSQARSIRGVFSAACWGIAVLGGGIQMKNLSNYKTVLSSCILAMLPCNCCCFLGIPFGIWGLVAINRWDVKREFD